MSIFLYAQKLITCLLVAGLVLESLLASNIHRSPVEEERELEIEGLKANARGKSLRLNEGA
jgi:hypothetical protein